MLGCLPERSSTLGLDAHLGLLGSAAAALGTLDLLHVRIAIHTDVGLVFVGLVVVHLVQRRRTLARMATQIVRATSRPGNSRNSSQKRSARASGHCVIVRAEARVRYVPGLRPGPRPPLQLPPARAG
jgi:hypothetical protein